MPDNKVLKSIYNTLKNNDSFQQAKSYEEFAAKMKNPGYNNQIFSLYRKNGGQGTLDKWRAATGYTVPKKAVSKPVVTSKATQVASSSRPQRSRLVEQAMQSIGFNNGIDVNDTDVRAPFKPEKVNLSAKPQYDYEPTRERITVDERGREVKEARKISDDYKLATSGKFTPAKQQIVDEKGNVVKENTIYPIQPQEVEYSQQMQAFDKQMKAEQAQQEKQLADAKKEATKDYNKAIKGSVGKELNEFNKLSTFQKFALGFGNLNPNGIMDSMYRRAEQTEGARNAQARLDMLDEAQNIIREVKAEKTDKSGIVGFFQGAGRGLAQKAASTKTWSFGGRDTNESLQLLGAVMAYDNGVATDEQKKLLEVAALKMGITSKYEDQLGRGYKAGQVTGESLPFMVEMMMNPISGLGKGASKGLGKYLVKKYGKQAIEKNMKKYIGAKIATRVGADIFAGYGMALTSSAAHTAADVAQNMTGDIQNGIDEKGNTVYAGHTKGDSFGKAFVKGTTRQAIENQSELVGEYELFEPIKKYLGKWVGKAVGKVDNVLAGTKAEPFYNTARNFVTDLSKNEGIKTFSKNIKEFQSKTKWNGTLGEYFEEVVGNVENAISVGDNDFGTEKGKGVFNLSDNIDTFLGVSLMGGAFAGAKTLGYAGYKLRGGAKGKAQRAMDDIDAKLNSLHGDKWSIIKKSIDIAKDDGIALNDILTDVMTTVKDKNTKKLILDYAKNQQIKRGAEMADFKPRTANIKRSEKDGKFGVQWLDKNGNEIGSRSFDSKERADAYEQELRDEQVHNDMRNMYDTATGINMRDAANAYNPEDENWRGTIAQKAKENEEKTKAAIAKFEADNGMKAGDVKRILNKEAWELTDKEQSVVPALNSLLKDLAYPTNVVNEEHFEEEGAAMADNAGFENDTPNVDVAQAARQEYEAAKAAYEKALNNNEILKDEVQSRLNKGMKPADILMDLEGFTDEELDTVSRFFNADAKFNGFMDQTQKNIQNAVGEKVDEHTFRGTINGVPDTKNRVEISNGKETFTLIGGELTTDDNGNVVDRGKTNLVVARNSDGDLVLLPSTDKLTILPNSQTLEDFGNQLYQELGANATEAIDPNNDLVQSQAEAAQEQVTGNPAEEAPQEETVPVNEEETPANENGSPVSEGEQVEGEEAPTDEQQPSSEPQQEKPVIPTDKDGVKLYENGVDAGDALGDMLENGDNVDEIADAAIAEADEAINAINSKKTKSRKDLVERKKHEQIKKYYEDLKSNHTHVDLDNGYSSELYGDNRGFILKDGKIIYDSEGKFAPVPTEDEINALMPDESNGANNAATDAETGQMNSEESINNEVEDNNETENDLISLYLKDAQAAIKKAIEKYGNYIDADFSHANDVKELVSMFFGKKRFLAWKSYGNKRGLEAELGWTRKIGGDTQFIETMLAKNGEGMSIDEFVHMIWESSENGGRFDDQEIRNAVLNIISSAQSKADIFAYMFKSRIAAAEKAMEAEERAAENNAEYDYDYVPEDYVPDGIFPDEMNGEIYDLINNDNEQEGNDNDVSVDETDVTRDERSDADSSGEEDRSAEPEVHDTNGQAEPDRGREEKGKSVPSSVPGDTLDDATSPAGGTSNVQERGKSVEDKETTGDKMEPVGDYSFIENNEPVEYKGDGKRHSIISVVHSGEQVSATQFSKPRLEKVYITDNKGGMIEAKPEDLTPYKDKSNPVETAKAIAEERKQEKAKSEEKTQAKKKVAHKLVSDERYEELKKRMREKLYGQMNMGIDPEILTIGAEMAVYHIEAGAIKFADYAKNMIEDLGEAIRPYLKSFYNAVRDMPEAQDFSKKMDSYADVAEFNVLTFDQKEAKTVNDNKKENNGTEKGVSLQQEGDLFSQQLNDTNNEQGEQTQTGERGTLRAVEGTDESEAGGTTERTESKALSGNIPEQGTYESGQGSLGERGTDRGSERAEQGSEGPDTSRVRTRSEQSGTEHSGHRHSLNNNTRNNVNERGVSYAPVSRTERVKANIEAIRIANKIEEEGRIATKEEMEVMRKYSGWGGIGTLMERPEFEQELHEVMTDEEFTKAANSAETAYYTPEYVISGIWDIAKSLGFNGGNILEGSAGIGSFIGYMPTDISRNSDIHAVEIDPVSGKILKALYPDAQVDVKGFQDVNIKNGSVDLAVTNVPFARDTRVFDNVDKDLSRKFSNLHDYCIAKNVRKLKEGGIGIFVTTSGTMDKSAKLRKWLLSDGNADVIGAFRLPNGSFDNASVTTDIIVIRKRVDSKPSINALNVADATIIKNGEYPTGEYDRNGEEIMNKVVMQVNRHFTEHPEDMAGTMKFAYEVGDTFRPGSQHLYPNGNLDEVKAKLNDWVKRMERLPKDEVVEKKEEAATQSLAQEATQEREGAMTINSNGEICLSRGGRQVPIMTSGKTPKPILASGKVKGKTRKECFNDYIAIRDAVNELLDKEVETNDDAAIQPYIDKLNAAYDKFVSRYGQLTKNIALSWLRNDVDFNSIAALENYSEKRDNSGKLQPVVSKSDIFSKRVVGKVEEKKPTTVEDAIVKSISKTNTINLDYIASELARTREEIKSEAIEKGLAFENPATGELEPKFRYLSGNVREKLQIAKDANESGEYNANIKALEKALPHDIPAHLIEINLGSTWVPVDIFKQFFEDRFDYVPDLVLNGGAWVDTRDYAHAYSDKNRSTGVHSEEFNKWIYGAELAMAAINNKTIVVQQSHKTWDGKKETIKDKKATEACTNRINEIKDDFVEWFRDKVRNDSELADRVTRIYNDKFNNYVPVKIDDSYLPIKGYKENGSPIIRFDGASETLSMREHQAKGAIRALSSPVLFAHEVGMGKSFTMITAAMEMRRIGTAKKPMMVVQNATVSQIVSEIKRLYPRAKVLSMSDKEHTASGRQIFYNKIKYNDWDIIVVPQSVFDRIPDDPNLEAQFIQDKIDEKLHSLEAAQAAGIKGMELANMKKEIENMRDEFAQKSKEALEKNHKKALNNAEVNAMNQIDRQTDDVESFQDMGIDALFVDEAHNYKKLGFATTMGRGVKGIDQSYSKRAAALYIKAHSIMQNNGWKNVVFATGTPISNTAAEIWTFMRYLIPKDILDENDIYYFDDFVHNFGKISQVLGFTTSGKFKEETRFASYGNVPELERLWGTVADTVLSKDAPEVNEKLPDAETKDVFIPQTKAVRTIMASVRRELEAFEKMSGAEKKENSSIPLVMFGIAQRAAIDPRLVMLDAADDEGSKTNKCVGLAIQELENSKDYNGVITIFSDRYRLLDRGSEVFNLFEDIKQKLVAKGISADKIVIMKSGMTDAAKQKIFDAANSGEVRVVMGSTETLGTGVNIQERMVAEFHLDVPNRPMDYTQRVGRLVRQGNLHKEWGKGVRVYRLGVEDTLDVTGYQRLKTKAGFIDSIMDGAKVIDSYLENRSIEDSDEEGLFDNPVAVLSGSQYALKKNAAERVLRKLLGRKQQYEADQTYIYNKLRANRYKISSDQNDIEALNAELNNIKELFPDGEIHSIKIVGKECKTEDDITKTLKEKVNDKVNKVIEDNRGNANFTDTTLSFPLEFDGVKVTAKVKVTREIVYETKGGSTRPKYVMHKSASYETDVRENGEPITVNEGLVKNVISDMQYWATGEGQKDLLERRQNEIKKLEEDNKQMEAREGKPFDGDEEIKKQQEIVDELTEKMKQEIAEKEAKYAEDAKDAKSINELSLVDDEESEETSYRDEGTESRREENKAVQKSVSDTIRNLNAGKSVIQVRSIEDAPKDVQQHIKEMHEQGKKVHGWYRNGKVYLFMPDITSRHEAVVTILHELVGHKGLRDVFGKVGYQNIMRALWLNGPKEMREWVLDHIDTRGWDFYKAMDEYLAAQAEKGGNLGFWQNIRRILTDVLNKLGINVDLNIYDTKYLLWASKNQIKEGNPISVAKRNALLRKFGAQDVSAVTVDNRVYDNSNLSKEELDKFSEDEKIGENDTPIAMSAKAFYHDQLKRASFVWNEAYADYMASLKSMQEAIGGKEIPDSQNAYMAENAMSSRNQQEGNQFIKDCVEPLQAIINKCIGLMGWKLTDLERYLYVKHGLERNRVFAFRDWINNERKKNIQDVNELSEEEKSAYEKAEQRIWEKYEDGVYESEAERDADLSRALNEVHNLYLDNLQTQWETMRSEIKDKLAKNEITFAEYCKKMDDFINDNIDAEWTAGKNDMSGLSSMYSTDEEENGYDDEELINRVMDVEASMMNDNVKELWERINIATRFAVEKEYASGVISKESRDRALGMFDFYVPLRNFAEETAEDVYQYMNDKGSKSEYVGSTLKRAKGRKSEAKHPIATILAMATNAISRGNRNEMKQRFARLIRANYDVDDKDRLVTEHDVWIVNTANENESDNWETAYPNLLDDNGEPLTDTDEIAERIAQFNNMLAEKKRRGKARKVSESGNIPYHVLSDKDKAEHIVEVRFAGKPHMFIVNGNPRAAQAINGKLNPSAGAYKLFSAINGMMSAAMTSYSLTFAMRNATRDFEYFYSSLNAKEGSSYANAAVDYYKELGTHFVKNRNVADKKKDKVMPLIHVLFRKYKAGTLNEENEIEKDFKDFVDNGGVTGFTQMKNVDDWYKELNKVVNKLNANGAQKALNKASDALDTIGSFVDGINEGIENMARFATYRASRHKAGRSVLRSVSDAKDVTVNFNRKGAGAKTAKYAHTTNAKIAGHSAQFFRGTKLFFNASMQAIMNAYRVAKNHPIKFIRNIAAIPFAIGVAAPLINAALFAMLGGDGDDPYADLPEFDRRSNWCIYIGNNSFFKIPISQEMKPFVGLGDLLAGYIYNPNLQSINKNAIEQIVELMALYSPVDVNTTRYGEDGVLGSFLNLLVPQAVSPIAEVASNTSWTNRPIQKENAFNENAPEYQKAYRNTYPSVVEMSKKWHELWGGDEAKRSQYSIGEVSPAYAQYLTEQYTGGVGKFVASTGDNIVTFAKWLKGEDVEFNVRNLEGVKAFFTQGDDNTILNRKRAKYYKYLDEAKKTDYIMSAYRHEAERGNVLSTAKMYDLGRSNTYKRAKIAEAYGKALSDLNRAQDLAKNNAEKKQLQNTYNQLLMECVEKLDSLNDGGSN